MKLSFKKEIDVKSVEFIFTINSVNWTSYFTINYTCPECAGHGCKAPDCLAGNVSKNIKPSDLVNMLDEQEFSKIYGLIEEFSRAV